MAAPDFKSAATLTPGVVCAVGVPSSEAPLLTVGSAHGLRITSASLCNQSGSDVDVTLSVVPSGGTAGATNRILSAQTVAAGDTYPLNDLLKDAMLGPSDFISGVGTATGVAFVVTGTVAA